MLEDRNDCGYGDYYGFEEGGEALVAPVSLKVVKVSSVEVESGRVVEAPGKPGDKALAFLSRIPFLCRMVLAGKERRFVNNERIAGKYGVRVGAVISCVRQSIAVGNFFMKGLLSSKVHVNGDALLAFLMDKSDYFDMPLDRRGDHRLVDLTEVSHADKLDDPYGVKRSLEIDERAPLSLERARVLLNGGSFRNSDEEDVREALMEEAREMVKEV